MTFAEAVSLLAGLSKWKRSEVERDPTDCLWAASAVLVEARDVIEAEKRRAHPSEPKRGDL